MLHLILGRAGSGKTHYLRDLLAQRAQSGEEGILFLVPDQYSFETEKAMLSLLGAAGTVSVETMGFSRLCELLFRTYGGCAVSHLDEGGRAVVMRNAIKQCADRMTVYRHHCGSDSFIASMLSLATECKRSAVAPEQLRAAAADAQPALQAKAQELSLLLGAYDALLISPAPVNCFEVIRSFKDVPLPWIPSRALRGSSFACLSRSFPKRRRSILRCPVIVLKTVTAG